MATKNPRLTITITPSLAAQLRRMSELTGNSQSSLIAELLDGTGPVFEKMLLVLEAAAIAKESLRGRISDELDGAHKQLEGALMMAQEGFDLFSKPILDEAEKVQRRASKKVSEEASNVDLSARLEGEPTPISNRGVRSEKTIASKSSNTLGKPEKHRKNCRGVKNGSF